MRKKRRPAAESAAVQTGRTFSTENRATPAKEHRAMTSSKNSIAMWKTNLPSSALPSATSFRPAANTPPASTLPSPARWWIWRRRTPTNKGGLSPSRPPPAVPPNPRAELPGTGPRGGRAGFPLPGPPASGPVIKKRGGPPVPRLPAPMPRLYRYFSCPALPPPRPRLRIAHDAPQAAPRLAPSG